MEKQTINDLSLLNATNIDSVQLSDMTINSRFVDSTQMKNALEKIDNNSRLLSSILGQMDEKTDFLMSTKDIINQMIVADLSTWYYDSNAILHPYPSLYDALTCNPEFSGRINIMADINYTGPGLELSSNGMSEPRKITIDLNNHTISCSNSQFMTVSYGTELTLQHGTLVLPKLSETASNEFKFQIRHGSLSLKDIKIDADISKNNSTWYYRMFNISQKYDEFKDKLTCGRSELYIDKDCEIDMYNAKHGECVILSFSPYYSSVVNPKEIAADVFWSTYGTAEQLMPIITIDGVIRTKSYNDTDGTYPCIIGGNGSDKLDTIINITDNARLYAQQHGLYLGNKGVINITGNPIIIAGTGICMRSGKLNISRDANPTIIGTGPKKAYRPIHQLTNGNDWGNSLDLGHAVLLENNGPTNYGGCPVSADIQAGTFISYNNTAFGSYGIATDKFDEKYSDDYYANGEFYNLYNYTTTKGVSVKNKKCYFFKRTEMFADGIQTQRRESQEQYDYLSGFNPDYRITKRSTDDNAIINAIKFEKGVKFDISNDAGLLIAVQKIAELLGASEVTTGLTIATPQGGVPLPNTEPTDVTNVIPTVEIEDPDIDFDVADSGSLPC